MYYIRSLSSLCFLIGVSGCSGRAGVAFVGGGDIAGKLTGLTLTRRRWWVGPRLMEKPEPPLPFSKTRRISSLWSEQKVLRASLHAQTPPADAVNRIYILRHGQTNWNAEKRIQGSSDHSSLTQKGKEEARTVASYIKNLSIAKVYISPLTRAQQTFDILLDTLSAEGKSLPAPTVIDDLREIDLYEWQGLLKDEVLARYPNEYSKWRGARPSELVLASGHSPIQELWARARRVWKQVLVESDDNQACGAILVVGHNAVNQALLCTFMGLDEDNFRKFEVSGFAALLSEKPVCK